MGLNRWEGGAGIIPANTRRRESSFADESPSSLFVVSLDRLVGNLIASPSISLMSISHQTKVHTYMANVHTYNESRIDQS